MKILNVRNVHTAFPYALRVLEDSGVRRNSRNGAVIQAPWPVVTVYEKPCERVIFWPERDANPFFHLYEALWMLAGRNDVAPLERYVKNSINYSDDGVTLHGAYGHRWREGFGLDQPHSDQLVIIANQLKENPQDRRCVLQMWSMESDLGRNGKDVPCNTIATLQRDHNGDLNIVVFCRSNDIIWGCYGANAVQFSMLLEYMALWIGCRIGTYSQVSVNWHAYDNDVWKKVENIRPDRLNYVDNPYSSGKVFWQPMVGNIDQIDLDIQIILANADRGDYLDNRFETIWGDTVNTVLRAHHIYKITEGVEKYKEPLKLLQSADQKIDWVVAAREWLERRLTIWMSKRGIFSKDLDHL